MKAMKLFLTVAASSVFSVTAFSGIALFQEPLEPSDAYFEAQDVALQEIQGTAYRALQVSVSSGYKGKFRTGDFGQYFFQFTGNVPVGELVKPAECNVDITVRKVPFAKQLDYILESVTNDYQVTASVGSLACKGLD